MPRAARAVAQRVAARRGHAHHVLVVRAARRAAPGAGVRSGRPPAASGTSELVRAPAFAKALVVGAGMGAPRRSTPRAAQLDAQHGGLERVEAGVHADLVVLVAAGSSRARAAGQPVGERVVVGGDQAAVAGGAEVLGRVEAPAAATRPRPTGAAPAGVAGADRLGGVLDQRHAALAGEGEQRVEIGGAAVEVHRQDRAQARAAVGGGARRNRIEAVARGSMSAKTGRAPSRATAPAVAKKVNDGQITSSPGPTSSACSASSSASDPDAQPTPRPASHDAPPARARSASTSSPSTKLWRSKTRSTAARSSSRIDCVLRAQVEERNAQDCHRRGALLALRRAALDEQRAPRARTRRGSAAPEKRSAWRGSAWRRRTPRRPRSGARVARATSAVCSSNQTPVARAGGVGLAGAGEHGVERAAAAEGDHRPAARPAPRAARCRSRPPAATSARDSAPGSASSGLGHAAEQLDVAGRARELRRGSGPSPTTTSRRPSRANASTARSARLYGTNADQQVEVVGRAAVGLERSTSTGGYTIVASRCQCRGRAPRTYSGRSRPRASRDRGRRCGGRSGAARPASGRGGGAARAAPEVGVDLRPTT
jgi:hypothetical protein